MALRDTLRTETQAAHQKLDDFVGQMNIFKSAENYRAFLMGMNRLYKSFGQHADWASEQAELAASVSKLTDAIRSDGSFSKNELQWVMDDDPLSDSEAAKWAVGYVLEGSAMGARYMVKAAEKLVRSLPPKTTTPIGVKYLQTLAHDSYERWPIFTAALNTADCDAEVAVRSATQVFVTAQKIFETLADELLQTQTRAESGQAECKPRRFSNE